ncbi:MULTISPECIES: hypothetical protein [unclassified Streptomyces]|uniref:hypothetical protein n=1 Tax=unclassified Streptomyces TaxID=2593676 RepID=UPI0021D87537|nr:hypothetical protein [Streptomyces sp. A13(2022)]MCU8589927.1 hypothetical protein [Streptomyces sp. A13(2022)]
MARRLTAYVHVDGEWYGPDSKVPARVASKIGEHAWEDGPETAVVAGSGTKEPPIIEAPPRSGRGSGVEAWLAFAEAYGVGTDSDMSRDDVIAACEAAGVVEPEQPKE